MRHPVSWLASCAQAQWVSPTNPHGFDPKLLELGPLQWALQKGLDSLCASYPGTGIQLHIPPGLWANRALGRAPNGEIQYSTYGQPTDLPWTPRYWEWGAVLALVKSGGDKAMYFGPPTAGPPMNALQAYHWLFNAAINGANIVGADVGGALTDSSLATIASVGSNMGITLELEPSPEIDPAMYPLMLGQCRAITTLFWFKNRQDSFFGPKSPRCAKGYGLIVDGETSPSDRINAVREGRTLGYDRFVVEPGGMSRQQTDELVGVSN